MIKRSGRLGRGEVSLVWKTEITQANLFLMSSFENNTLHNDVRMTNIVSSKRFNALKI